MRLSQDLQISLSLAMSEAGRLGHEYAGLEHLLYALTFDDEASDVLRHAGADVRRVQKLLADYLEEEIEGLEAEEDELEPRLSLAAQRTLARAAVRVEGSGREEIRGSDLIVALFEEPESYAVDLLQEQGVTRLDVVSFLAHGASKVGSLPAGPIPAGGSGPSAEEDDRGPWLKGDPLEAFAQDLTEMARNGAIDPLIGREKEIGRTLHILQRRRKNNPIYVGDPGVGKTALVEGLALRIAKGTYPSPSATPRCSGSTWARSWPAPATAATSRTASRECSRPWPRRRARSCSSTRSTPWWAPAPPAAAPWTPRTSSSPPSRTAPCAASAPPPGRSSARPSSATRPSPAASRRSRSTSLPSRRRSRSSKGCGDRYEAHHGVRYTLPAIRAAVDMSARYLRDRRLPDKAIDLLDEAGAAVSLRGGKRVTVPDLEVVLATMAQIPARSVKGNDREQLQRLEDELKKVIFGQDEAIERLVGAIKVSRAGLRDPQKPVGSFLLTGPTGVGKTELAKQLAESLGIAFLRFDMSEYMESHSVSRLVGAPPGYVGFDRGGLLTESVSKNPHAVLLLDEVEKAHPDIFNILLQVMDHGTLTDTNGKQTDFRHVILLMTSNVGARELAQRALGFNENAGEGRPGISGRGSEADRAVERLFSPEFRNRLDARVRFNALTPDLMEKIVEKFIHELGVQIAEKKVRIEISEARPQAPGREGLRPRLRRPPPGPRHRRIGQAPPHRGAALRQAPERRQGHGGCRERRDRGPRELTFSGSRPTYPVVLVFLKYLSFQRVVSGTMRALSRLHDETAPPLDRPRHLRRHLDSRHGW